MPRIAAAMALTVVEPSGNGLGSDAFAILWDGQRAARPERLGPVAGGVDAASGSPGGAAMPELGWDSVTVPGAVSAWAALARRFGRLPLPVLAEPAIRYARHGFLVSPIIAELWRRTPDRFADQPGFAEAFLPGGRPPAAGELFRHEAQAASLELIAETAGEAFYRGSAGRAAGGPCAGAWRGHERGRSGRPRARMGRAPGRAIRRRASSTSCRRTARASPR